jgi:Ca-activated chloride channel family protein
VGSRTFLLRDGAWIDTAFDPSAMTAAPVTFLSDAYFELLGARPELRAAFALGARVIALAADGTPYEVTEAPGQGPTAGHTGAATATPSSPPAGATRVSGVNPDVTPAGTARPATPIRTSAWCLGAMLLPLAAVGARVWRHGGR